MRGEGEEKGGWESEGMVERRGGGEGREEKRKGVRAEGVRKVRYLSICAYRCRCRLLGVGYQCEVWGFSSGYTIFRALLCIFLAG